MNSIIEWLNKHLPEKCDSSIVHGDFRLGNLIFNKDSKTINSVLDWELSTIGDPLADFDICFIRIIYLLVKDTV